MIQPTRNAELQMWRATVETWRGKPRGVITRPWPEGSHRLGNQRVVCPHKAHGSHALALACAQGMVADHE